MDAGQQPPQGWNAEMWQSWVESGGTIETAQSCGVAGWTVHEIWALRGCGLDLAGVAPPAGSAELHRAHGDTLVGLLIGEWPAVPPTTVWSVARRTTSGDRQRYLILRDGGFKLRRLVPTGDGLWSATDETLDTEDLEEVLARRPDLTTLRKGRSAQFGLSPGVALDLAGMLQVSADGGPEDPDDWGDADAPEWADDDGYIRELWDDLPWVPRWASLPGLRVTALQEPGTPEPRLHPILIDMAEEQIVADRALVTHSWFSEAGGAPVSWDGGGSIDVLADNIYMERFWGDVEQSQTLIQDVSPARVVGGFIRRVEGSVAAAFALEPLDPGGTLGEAERRVWRELCEGVEASFTFGLGEDDMQALRRELAESSRLYRMTTQALAEPTTALGQRLHASLRDTVSSGVLGPLTWGEWATSR